MTEGNRRADGPLIKEDGFGRTGKGAFHERNVRCHFQIRSGSSPNSLCRRTVNFQNSFTAVDVCRLYYEYGMLLVTYVTADFRRTARVFHTMRFFPWFVFLVVAELGACSNSGGSDNGTTNTNTRYSNITVTNLYALADFPIGVAVPAGSASNSLLASQDRQAVVNTHFNALTAENIMKPDALHPAENSYFFTDADALVSYAQAHGMVMHGHTLLWYQAVPGWMENYVGDTNAWIAMMESHVTNVAGHFAGDVASWDVLNEAFNDDGSYRQTFWYNNIGVEYIERAFDTARAADANADLYYNDYNISGLEDKLNAVLIMVDDFQNRGVAIDGIGFQMHISLSWPAIGSIRESFAAVVSRGLKVRISELDVSVNESGTLSVLTDQIAVQQADRYRDVVAAYVDIVPLEQRGGITVWGITDADSWIPYFWSRLDWPLLFHGNYQPKKALQGFADGLTGN